jgi:class 3 adenylate cyclase/tetratricopeptide (TPR) repeat protein
MKRAERKPITALFCDLVGSTSIGEHLDAEALQNVQTAYFGRMRSVVEHHGGTVEKFIGDAVVAVFGAVRLHEDDAERAARCALGMREALAGLNDSLRPRFGFELALRIGMASGEAFVSGGPDALATGDVMNTAARLEQAAEEGEILAERTTMLLTRAAVEFAPPRRVQAKGKAEPVEVWPVTGIAARARRRRLNLVGRERELEQLAAALESAIRAREARVAVVLGEPGIGKSRLADEFSARTLGRALVYRSSCPAYGDASAWGPLAEVVRQEVGIAETDPPDVAYEKLHVHLRLRHAEEEASLVEAQLGPVVGATRAPVSSGPELVWALRCFLEGLAARGPAVVVFDDLHWASETLIETLQELVDTIGAAPLVLVFQGRPELAERIAFVLADSRTTTIAVKALSPGEARELAATLAVDEALAERAEGNPLFLEELAAMVAEGPGTSGIPRSLRTLIAARLDQLPAEAKALSQAAALIGDVFWEEAVAALIDGTVTTASGFALLETRGVIDEEATSSFPGSRQFRFHHALIREVAYESLPKRDRALMHRAAAEWFGQRAEERQSLLASVAHHLDRAVSAVSDLAPLEEPDPRLVEVATRAQLRAADWAEANAVSSEALRLAERALELSASRASLHELSRARVAVALLVAGRGEEAATVAQQVVVAASSPETRAYASLALAGAARDEKDTDAIRTHAGHAIEVARLLGLRLVEVSALRMLGWAEIGEAKHLEAEACEGRIVEIASELGDKGTAAGALAVQGINAMWRGEIRLAEERALEAMNLARESGSVRALARALSALAHLRREQGRMEEAVEYGRERLRRELELSDKFTAVGACALTLAPPLIELGRLDEAWEVLEQGLAISSGIGASWFEEPLRHGRATILSSWGRLDEAEAELLSAIDEGSSARRFHGSSGILPALAKLRAAQGRPAEAEQIWREVLSRPVGQARVEEADLELGFAEFLVERGRTDEAVQVLEGPRSWVPQSGAGRLELKLAQLDGSIAAQAPRPNNRSMGDEIRDVPLG